MAEANLALLAGEKVTDVAFKYGYQSIEGFSRAFRDWSGQAPSEVMKTQIQKRSLNSLSILILKEDNQWMLN